MRSYHLVSAIPSYEIEPHQAQSAQRNKEREELNLR